jgi:hypothetical protein
MMGDDKSQMMRTANASNGFMLTGVEIEEKRRKETTKDVKKPAKEEERKDKRKETEKKKAMSQTNFNKTRVGSIKNYLETKKKQETQFLKDG